VQKKGGEWPVRGKGERRRKNILRSLSLTSREIKCLPKAQGEKVKKKEREERKRREGPRGKVLGVFSNSTF